MRIVLFGATGQIGQQILKQGLERGHSLTVLLRSSGEFTPSHPKLTLKTGNALNYQDVACAIPDHDSLVNAMAPGGPGVSDQYLNILTDGSRHIVGVMQAAGIRRLVALGSVATLQVAPGILLRATPQFPAFASNISSAHLQALQTYRASDTGDTADFVLNEIERGQHIHHLVNVAY